MKGGGKRDNHSRGELERHGQSSDENWRRWSKTTEFGFIEVEKEKKDWQRDMSRRKGQEAGH